MQTNDFLTDSEPHDGAADDVGTDTPELEPAAQPSTATVERPESVPEKFWDSEAGAVRTEALLQSYLELERRLGRSLPKPESDDDAAGMDRLWEALGRPKAPDQYDLTPSHPLIEPDPAVNQKLHEAGFTQRQAQLVYDLAAEHILPIVSEASSELAATRQIDRLKEHFGGEEAWRTTSRQIKAYADANLPAEVSSALSTSFEGVLALHDMMRKAEPDIIGMAGSGQMGASEESLQEMIRDPRYWRDRDPTYVRRVTEGYRNLYPD